MYKNKILAGLLTLLLFINIYSQNNTVQLKIFSSETGYLLSPDIIKLTGNNNNQIQTDKASSINLPAGIYHLLVSQQGYSTCETYFSLEGKDISIRLYLDPMEKNPLLSSARLGQLVKDNYTLLLGFVVDDETGVPLSNVTIRDERTNITCVTNSEGYFEFSLLSDCDITKAAHLTFNKTSYNTKEYKKFLLTPKTDFAFNIRLKKGSAKNHYDLSEQRENKCEECEPDDSLLTPYTGFVLPLNIRVEETAQAQAALLW